MEKVRFQNGLVVSLLVIGFLFAILILNEATATAAPPGWWKGSSEEYNQLVSNAEKEGKIFWNDSSDEESAGMIIQAFNKLYPKIKIDQVRAHGLDSRELILRELYSGATKIDVLEISDELQDTYAELKLFKKVDWMNKFQLDPIAPNKEGTQIKIGGSLHGAAYNTDKVSPQDVPKSWEDFLDPKWKGGKIGTDMKPKTWAHMWPVWGDKKMIEFLNKLAQQKPLFKRGTTALVQSLAAGEFVLMAGTTFSSYYSVKIKGAPIAFYLPEPLVAVSFEKLGVLFNAPNPNAAILFLGWLASGGQEVFDKVSYGQGMPLPTYNTMAGRLVKSLDKSKVQLFVFDDAWLPKMAEFTEKGTKALGMQK